MRVRPYRQHYVNNQDMYSQLGNTIADIRRNTVGLLALPCVAFFACFMPPDNNVLNAALVSSS